jgi:hypothetical protein
MKRREYSHKAKRGVKNHGEKAFRTRGDNENMGKIACKKIQFLLTFKAISK